MTTFDQIRANQQNAQKSTGPRTEEGKAKVSQNRRTHGLTGGHVILPDESLEDYELLELHLIRAHQPANETERFLVEQAAELEWKLIRAAKWEQKETVESGPFSPKFDKIARYQNQIRRAHIAILRELRLQQSERLKKEEREQNQRREEISQELDRKFANACLEKPPDDSKPIDSQVLMDQLAARAFEAIRSVSPDSGK